MKKLLTLMTAISLTAVPTTFAISCQNNNDNKELITAPGFWAGVKDVQNQIIKQLKISEDKVFKSEEDMNSNLLPKLKLTGTKNVKISPDITLGNKNANQELPKETPLQKNAIYLKAIRASYTGEKDNKVIVIEFFKSNGASWEKPKFDFDSDKTLKITYQN